MVSALNDALTRRVIELAAARRSLAGAWCWLALGSEGRMEQTLVTDQDNALIVEGDPQSFLAFADQVNRDLDACGYPLCKGDIMARNPRWCLTPAQWRAAFDDWIRNTNPEALLHAGVFFDFRALAGEPRLAGTLRDAVLAQTQANRAFCHAMAQAALQARPPLGLLSDFSGDELDLKLAGVRPFVDAARVLALSAGRAETEYRGAAAGGGRGHRGRRLPLHPDAAPAAREQPRARRRAERHRPARAEGRVPPGDPAAAAARARLRPMTWFRRTPLEGARWVVIDCETSGLDAARDRLLSVGAVVVRDGAVVTARILRSPGAAGRRRAQPRTSSSTASAATRSAAGSRLPKSSTRLARFLGDGFPVGFHAPFDAAVLRRHGLQARAKWLDLATLAPALFPAKGKADSPLEHWLVGIRHSGARAARRAGRRVCHRAAAAGGARRSEAPARRERRGPARGRYFKVLATVTSLPSRERSTKPRCAASCSMSWLASRMWPSSAW